MWSATADWAPRRFATRHYLPFFGIDDWPATLPTWDDYPGYLGALDAEPPSLNVGVLAGHGTLRSADGQRAPRRDRRRVRAHGR
jgi:N-acyl-D-aspartate/D-glutamate deacylase